MAELPPTDQAWFNGRIVSLGAAAPSVASNSFHMATGVFDGLMAYWNRDHYYLHRAAEHLERFKAGCHNMDMDFGWSASDLEAGIVELLRHCPNRTHYIRPICYRGGPSVPSITWRGTSQPVDVSIFGVACGRDDATPMAAQISPIERISGRAAPVRWKACGVYVNSFLAQHTAEQAGFDTGVMLDRVGRLAEASTSNLFFVRGSELVTPALTPEIFPGITRKVIVEIAAKLGINVVERDVYPEELGDFDAAFLCATLIELRPLSCIGEHSYESSSHPMFVAVLDSFRKITHA